MREKIKKIYLSYGAGVVSEALRLWLLENGCDFEAVYVDHGCDWPETREFTHTIPNLTILKPNVQGYDNLYEYCFDKKLVPSLQYRWCTDRFKIQTMYRYFQLPCLVHIGFSWDESHRLKNSTKEEIYNQFLFIVFKWTRKDCIKYIKKLGKSIPIKSGCWFCPLQHKDDWILLRKRHFDLYQKAKNLEINCREDRIKRGKEPMTLDSNNKTLDILTQERQLELFQNDHD